MTADAVPKKVPLLTSRDFFMLGGKVLLHGNQLILCRKVYEVTRNCWKKGIYLIFVRLIKN